MNGWMTEWTTEQKMYTHQCDMWREKPSEHLSKQQVDIHSQSHGIRV